MKKCPRCNKELEKNTIRGVNVSVEVETCAGCGGTWFGKNVLSSVDKIVEPVAIEIRKLPSMDQQLRALNCPACENPVIMSKAYHNRDSKVIMDYCPHCKGIWLDKGELDAIQKENWLITLKNLYRWIIREEDSL
jgi:Zn-finger nucleic acid-binding protein